MKFSGVQYSNGERLIENRYWLFFLIFMILANLVAVAFPDHARYYTSESNFYPNLGAVSLFVAVLFMLATIWQLWQTEIKSMPFKKVWYTGFMGVLVLAFGEETSWGQHFFEFEVPESIREINEQQEFNLHNLKYVHGLHPDKSQKTGLLRWFTAHRMFYSFLAVFLVVVPFMNFLFGFFSDLMRKVQMIMPSRWTGVVLIMSFLLARVFQYGYSHLHPEMYHTLAEVMEVHIEITLLSVAIVFYRNARRYNLNASVAESSY
jgi:hypothetical protein